MKRAQESAPVEVLIGVTILAFVLIIAMNIFQSTCNSQYEQKLNAGFSKFARDLEFVYMGSVGTSLTSYVDLSPPNNCGNVRIGSIKILKGSAGICKAHLGKEDCMIIIASLPKKPGTPPTTNPQLITLEVIDMPSTVSLIYNNTAGCSTYGPLGSYDVSVSNTYPENCTLRSTYYNFKIKKVSQDEIEIDS